ncbi:MAG: hypothetical protein ACYTHN_06200, partial [Planctomycetota bacterium]
CREAAGELETLGIRVIIPREGYLWADLPIVLPELKGALLDEDTIFLGDVGGDDVGARILGSFAQVLAGRPYSLLLVLNANRPFTDTAEGCIQVIEEIEASSRLRTGGLISNTHLMEETDLETVKVGWRLGKEVSSRAGIPLRFITAPKGLEAAFREGEFDVPVLPIERTMLPPWKRREKIGSANFDLKGEFGPTGLREAEERALGEGKAPSSPKKTEKKS